MIPHWLKERLNRFFNRRGTETLPVQFGWRRIYVLPSKAGLFFFLMWLLMLMAGLNFNNNMSLMLVFLLFGLAQVALHKTFFNVCNLRLTDIQAEPVFLGEPLHITCHLSSDHPKYQVIVTVDNDEEVTDMADGIGQVRFKTTSTVRGWQPVSRVKLFSRYPLGLFTVWVYTIPKSSALVYPKPESPTPDFPTHGGLEGDQNLISKGDDLTSIRHYQPGDPVRDIAWKKSAQTEQVWLKEYQQVQGKWLTFDFDQMTTMGLEQKLSRLTAWVVAAEKQQLNYQLKLPQFTSDMKHGKQHLHRCLKELALFQHPQ